MATAVSEQLTAPERADLRKCCKVVDDGLATFMEVGGALKQISDSRLYRETHKSFESFVRDKWGISKQHALRLIDAVEIKADLAPIGYSCPIVKEIKTEGQLRELADVSEESLPEVMAAVAEKCEAEGVKPTAKVIREVVQDRIREPNRESAPKQESKDDRVVESSKRIVLESVARLRHHLGNLGAGRRFDKVLVEIEEFAR